MCSVVRFIFFFFQAEDGIRDLTVTGVQTCALPISPQTAGRLQYGPAANTLREARSPQVPVEKRAADYLQVAAMTAPLLGTGAQQTPAVNTYNAACGELTMLLRNSEGGRLDRKSTRLNSSH